MLNFSNDLNDQQNWSNKAWSMDFLCMFAYFVDLFCWVLWHLVQFLTSAILKHSLLAAVAEADSLF